MGIAVWKENFFNQAHWPATPRRLLVGNENQTNALENNVYHRCLCCILNQGTIAEEEECISN